MPLACTTTELADLSRCFICLTAAQRDAAKTYLLAVIAGGSTDPETLMEQAKDFQKLTPKQSKMLQTYLMCLISNA